MNFISILWNWKLFSVYQIISLHLVLFMDDFSWSTLLIKAFITTLITSGPQHCIFSFLSARKFKNPSPTQNNNNNSFCLIMWYNSAGEITLCGNEITVNVVRITQRPQGSSVLFTYIRAPSAGLHITDQMVKKTIVWLCLCIPLC